MKKDAQSVLDGLIDRYPVLAGQRSAIASAFGLLRESFLGGGKLLLCGNGGSAADCQHIVGELMKNFMLRRPVQDGFRERMQDLYPEKCGPFLESLQGALPAVSLPGQTAINSAYVNDARPDMVYAQQVYGLCVRGDTVMAISTSGNSENVVNAVMTARAKYAHTIALTGERESRLSEICDVAVRVPGTETYRVQELHLPVYHALCSMLELEFFGKPD